MKTGSSIKRAPARLSEEPMLHPELRQIQGGREGSGFRIGLVISRFNEILTQALFDTAVRTLREQGVADAAMLTVWVPGAFEIPSVLEQLAKRNEFDALIAMGVVIQGETTHADHIGQQVSRSICDIARLYAVPVIDGLICARTPEQAVARAGPGEHNRGRYAAQAAIEMAHVFEQLKA